MIASAIYELLNVTDITDLATGVYYNTAPQQAVYPYIVFTETANPEDFKTGSKIRLHYVDIQIVASRGRDGNSGFAELDAIREVIESKLNRFGGTSGGKVIQDTFLEGVTTDYDPESRNAFMLVRYAIRENYVAAFADPANYPINYTINVNGVEDSTGTINGYDDNIFNITV